MSRVGSTSLHPNHASGFASHFLSFSLSGSLPWSVSTSNDDHDPSAPPPPPPSLHVGILCLSTVIHRRWRLTKISFEVGSSLYEGVENCFQFLHTSRDMERGD